ncbi:MAG: ATP-binding protein [Bacteroidetes bacterium]|nr:ATP-binding protein [Bacteroidota bacterium]
MNKNPFRYGKVVDTPYFINRKDEIRQMTSSLQAGQSMIIYSPRRYGKTSLVSKVLKVLKAKGYHTIYLDFFRINSAQKFIEEYYKQIILQYTPWEKALKKFSSLVRGIKPMVTLNNAGIPEFSFQITDQTLTTTLAEIIDLPQKISGNKKWIVVFDEFQDINKLNGENFEKEMRSLIQFHTSVSYVFLGSKRHLLLNMFTRQNRAFYNFGKLIELQKIPATEMSRFITAGFKSTIGVIERELCLRLINYCDNIPYYIQYLASEFWDVCIEKNDTPSSGLLNEALARLIINQSEYFANLFEILTPYQQKVLEAITVENKNIFTKEYNKRHHLSANSSTQRAIKKLLEKEILEKTENTFSFSDPFFKKWLEENIL